jgi:serine/threonine-protein kinase
VNPSAASLRPFELGERIGGKYVYERTIAEGGMAVVVAASHQELGETVALKLLKPAMLVDQELVVRFAREAKATARVRSEYSVKVFDVGVDDRRGPFMVMEYLKGRDLRTVVEAEGRVGERRVAEIAIQACEALAAAHVLGIVHRDVKPENIFLTEHGNIESIRILDFGISKAALTGSVMNTDLSLVTTQMLMGSPVYMSPEQMRSSTHVDGRSDIWSLGITLYEALAGRPPFTAESVTQLCAMVLEKQPPHLREFNPDVSPAIADVVMHCLRKDPGQRFQNVGELALALLPFAPSRARLSVERIASLFEAIGVPVEVPDRGSSPPPPSIGAPRSSGAPLPERVSARADTVLRLPALHKRERRRTTTTVLAGAALFLASFALMAWVVPLGAKASPPAPPAPTTVTQATTSPEPAPTPTGDPVAELSPAVSRPVPVRLPTIRPRATQDPAPTAAAATAPPEPSAPTTAAPAPSAAPTVTRTDPAPDDPRPLP